jgi:pre-mRNA-splicing factor ATP-dependent RNA helicase DHX38/PRP16
MTGQEDIEATCEIIAERIATLEGVPPLLLLPMYSQLPAGNFLEKYIIYIFFKCLISNN